MSEVSKNFDAGQSAVARIKRRDALKRQRIAIVSVAIIIALLIAALAVVLYWIDIFIYEDVDGSEYYVKKIEDKYSLCYKSGDVLDKNDDGYYQTDAGTLVAVDAINGTCTRFAVVDTEGSEVVGYGEYVLMFKQLTYDNYSTKDESKVIKSIEVHNGTGEFTFYRDESGEFVIKGNENTPYSKETFAKLAVACGYTLSMRRLENPARLENGEIDYAEYGLAPREEYIYDGLPDCGTPAVVEVEPAYYVITTMTGESHKVIIGDATVTGTGYYAKYDGRDTIYILGSNGIGDVVLGRIEDIVTPTIVYPMGMTDYFNVADFVIYDDINYDAIYEELRAIYGDDIDNIDTDDFAEKYAEAYERNSRKVCYFDYIDADLRRNTMYSATPYFSALEYADGYYINSGSIDEVLYNLYATEFVKVEVLSPDENELDAYGLGEAPHAIAFLYKTADAEGNDAYVYNFVDISEKTKDGIYYAYSSTYDMIVSVTEASFDFLSWEEIEWYDPSYIQLDISHVTDIIVEAPGFKTHFEIDDSASRFMTYVAQSGNTFKVGDSEYHIVKNPITGRYGLEVGGRFVEATYNGDYLVTPLAYTPGVPEGEGFLFVESEEVDVDGDGNKDAFLYYYYGLARTEKGIYLAAQIIMADLEGNKIKETQAMAGTPYYTTDYFLTNSSYIYFTGKSSHVGKQLDKTYADAGRGRWGVGNLFVTASGKYVLVNAETGDWSIIDDISCGIYFADDTDSRLAKRAVEIPAVYDANGNIKRHPETYYPTTEKKVLYDDESGALQVYDYKNLTWRNATYNECTIGVWSEGSYYITEAGTIVVINGETGDWGVATLSAIENYVAEIFADGKLLDYNINTTNHVGSPTVSSATDNFKQFYKALVYASLEGMAELTEEEMAALAALDDFSVDSDGNDNPCQLKITILAEDFKGNRRDTVYRFYQYTERKSYITIEALDSSDPSTSDSKSAYGKFYVLRTFADKIIEDARKVANAEEVTAITKY